MHGFLVLLAFLCTVLCSTVLSWPGMGRSDDSEEYTFVSVDSSGHPHHKSKFLWQASSSERIIGPHCTVGAHNNFTQFGPCPDTPQPTSEQNYVPKNHIYAPQFQMDWIMYFVPNASDVPPYNTSGGRPTSAYNYTLGTTYYDINYKGSAMRESYYNRCIPVFSIGSMSKSNDYSCDFINVVDNELNQSVAYVVLHDDRPAGAPECCKIGDPFHPPGQNFASGMSVKFQNVVQNVVVDWSAVWLKGSGVFSYGFRFDSPDSYGIPFGFYMEGIPWIANWCYQQFSNFTLGPPDESVWQVPDSCKTARPCPGWEF